MQTDPVCGMKIDQQNAAAKSQYQGTTYYFCSDDCKQEFDQHPQQYAEKASQTQAGGQAQYGGTNR